MCDVKYKKKAKAVNFASAICPNGKNTCATHIHVNGLG